MENPNVTIVIAAYNYGRFLPQALDSVLAQTYHDWEAVVVDDGSTDNTRDLVMSYLSDPRVRYFRTDHLGQPAAKNYGVEQARGSFVAFLDADDYWSPDKLTKQLPLFSSEKVAVVYSLRRTIDELGKELVVSYVSPHRGDVLRQMFKDNFVCFSSAVVRRDVLKAVGLFDLNIPLAIDYDLWLRVATSWHFDYVAEPLVWYRTGHANLSRRANERIHIVLGIMDRVAANPSVASRLGRSWVNRCYGETYCNVASTMRHAPRAERRRWLWRSLWRYPYNRSAIVELLKTIPLFNWLKQR
jgi:glycosyltransferase involved in cell wall biosynthesis